MKTKNISQTRSVILFPVAGIIGFLLLYIIASIMYPGGSQFNRQAQGFSWINNYWCDLLATKAYNGEVNHGRPVAMAGMLLICLTLAVFWHTFPKHIRMSAYGKTIISSSGMLAMFVALFLSSRFHDEVIYISSALGLIALIGTFVGLWRLKWTKLFWFGIFNLAIFTIDHYIYYSRVLIEYLPVIQKLNFAFLLWWFAMISWKLYKRNNHKHVVPPA